MKQKTFMLRGHEIAICCGDGEEIKLYSFRSDGKITGIMCHICRKSTKVEDTEELAVKAWNKIAVGYEKMLEITE